MNQLDTDQKTMGVPSFSARELYILINGLEKLLTGQLAMRDQARVLQAVEYERRLEQLNHAHASAQAKEREFVSRVQYDIQSQQIERRVEANHTALISMSSLEGRVTGLYDFRDDVNKSISRYSTIPTELEVVKLQLSVQGDKLQTVEKKLTSIWSYGAGVAGVLAAGMVLLNVVLKYISK